ncbi:MAG: hypothetical protein KatS3mg057_0970 [Herpetosiphonaceae bacterium]|nr:MAG: hypothetical protein KatS3mg057_0970 [Herpetosiphonaceae bacterium]
MLTTTLLLALVLSYLLGAIPFALLVGKTLRGVDVQQAGSGNAGARNTLLTAGAVAAAIVAALDIGKAALAMLVGWQIGGKETATLCGAAAVVGHCFSPFLVIRWWGRLGGGWKLALRRVGGKGLASGIIVVLLVAWPAALIALAVFALGRLIIWNDETWPAVIAVAITAPLIWWWTTNTTVTIAVLIVAIIIIVKHLPDLQTTFYVGGEPERRERQ